MLNLFFGVRRTACISRRRRWGIFMIIIMFVCCLKQTLSSNIRLKGKMVMGSNPSVPEISKPEPENLGGGGGPSLSALCSLLRAVLFVTTEAPRRTRLGVRSSLAFQAEGAASGSDPVCILHRRSVRQRFVSNSHRRGHFFPPAPLHVPCIGFQKQSKRLMMHPLCVAS